MLFRFNEKRNFFWKWQWWWLSWYSGLNSNIGKVLSAKCNLTVKTKIKQPRPGMAHYKKTFFWNLSHFFLIVDQIKFPYLIFGLDTDF